MFFVRFSRVRRAASIPLVLLVVIGQAEQLFRLALRHAVDVGKALGDGLRMLLRMIQLLRRLPELFLCAPEQSGETRKIRADRA